MARWRTVKVWPQHVLPQRSLTRLATAISRSRLMARPLIGAFTRLYPVNIAEADRRLVEYGSFDEFFTRALKPGARAFPEDPATVTSPCDGNLSQLGKIRDGRIIQAKGRDFSVAELLTVPDWTQRFHNGQFATVYLAPHDYHRVHMPVSARLVAEARIPGRLFSVSNATSQAIDRLYARNERLVALFESDTGPLAVVMVAAMLVAGIETAWGDPGRRRPDKAIRVTPLDPPLELARGAELGRFHWGSTVIVLTGEEFPGWRGDLRPGQHLKLGQSMTEPRTRATGP